MRVTFPSHARTRFASSLCGRAQVLLTMVDVFLDWPRIAAVAYVALSLGLAYTVFRWSPNLVAWVNWLKAAVSAAIVWSAACLLLLEVHPGVARSQWNQWRSTMTYVLLCGLAPAFLCGGALSRLLLDRKIARAVHAIE